MLKLSRCAALSAWCLIGSLHAAPSLVATPGALGANDAVNWSQLGIDGATLSSNFSAFSAQSVAVTGKLGGSDGCVAVVNGSNCEWSPTTGFDPGDFVIWTENGGGFGSGPVTFSFAAALGAGMYVQSTSAGAFTVALGAYNGASLLGSYSVSSGDGSGVFVGVLDTNAEITSVQVSLTACASGCDKRDFAVNTLQLRDVVSSVPEPASGASLLIGLVGLGGLSLARRKNSKAIQQAQGVQA